MWHEVTGFTKKRQIVPVRAGTNRTSVFCKLLLNGASHDTKNGCIRFFLAGVKKYKFSFLLINKIITNRNELIILKKGK